ncbi:MAG: twin-arginine translocase TatA/TatE family subunit [Anaerolineales bacterium]|nr:twin-arginine translocase TatA/TatE family subunit [Anaerolineales bacterium]
MEIFGIGITEILFILLLALILLGPQDLQKYGRSLGEGLRKLVKSDTWRTITQTSRKLKDIPTELMREAGVDEMRREIEQTIAPPGIRQARFAAGARPPGPASGPWSESWEVDPDEQPAQAPPDGKPSTSRQEPSG